MSGFGSPKGWDAKAIERKITAQHVDVSDGDKVIRGENYDVKDRIVSIYAHQIPFQKGGIVRSGGNRYRIDDVHVDKTFPFLQITVSSTRIGKDYSRKGKK